MAKRAQSAIALTLLASEYNWLLPQKRTLWQ